MRSKPTFLLGAVALALAAAAAGCGGGGSKSASSTQAATTEQATTTTQAAATQAATSATTTTQAATTTPATSTTPNLSALVHGKCRDLVDLSQKFSSALTGASATGDLKKEADLLQEFTKQVPSDIRPDFQVVADYLTKVAAVIGKVKPGQTPDPDTLAKLQRLATSIDQTKLTQAGQHIEAWVQKNCKS